MAKTRFFVDPWLAFALLMFWCGPLVFGAFGALYLAVSMLDVRSQPGPAAVTWLLAAIAALWASSLLFLLSARLLRGGQLHHAARTGQNAWVQRAVGRRGLNVNVRTVLGVTPLHLAASSGNVHCISCLLAVGAEVNVLDHRGRTPLHFAARAGQLDAVRILVARGGARGAPDRYGKLAWHYAAELGHVPIAEFLAPAEQCE